jgi:putative glycosyltransferase (TIGR04372 family)
MIIDYATNGMRTDFMDIYLGAHCEFCISNGTGYDGVPTIFRRPILFIDHVPLLAISTFSDRDLITTKKHWLKNSNRFMTFEEIFRATEEDELNPYMLHKKLQIDLLESSPEEIKAAVIEMYERLEGKWQTTEEDEELQKRFWDLFPHSMNQVALGHGKIRSRMATRFLRDSKELLS